MFHIRSSREGDDETAYDIDGSMTNSYQDA
jgi:hypothetical protein